MRKLLAALVLLFPLLLRADAPVYQGTGLCRFVLHGYYLPPENEYKIDFIVADLLKRHADVFNFTPGPDLHVQIRIFGKFQDYSKFARTNLSGPEGEHLSENVSNLAGYFSGRDNEVVTWRQRDPSYLANNILHECSHAIMHQQYRMLPIWLDEGCAVYFSFPAFMRDEQDVGRLDYQWFVLKKWLEEGSLPGLRGFLNLTPPEFRAQDAARTYPVSWSLFQFLASTPENRAAMNTMIAQFQDQDPRKTDCAGLLDKSYPGGLVKMEKDWHAWIARGAKNVLGTRQFQVQ